MGAPDKNWISIADNPLVGNRDYDVVAPPDLTYADTLKFSNSQNGVIRGQKIIGGYEDCVDCNRNCSKIDVHFEEWEPHGKFVVTDKGGSRDNRFSGTILRHGGEMDVDLGNGSDQSNERTQRTRLNFRMADGSKVRVRVLNAWAPIFENAASNYVVNDTWKGVFIYGWLLWKRLGLP